MQYCADSFQTVTTTETCATATDIFSALENFNTKVSTIETLVTDTSEYYSAAPLISI